MDVESIKSKIKEAIKPYGNLLWLNEEDLKNAIEAAKQLGMVHWLKEM